VDSKQPTKDQPNDKQKNKILISISDKEFQSLKTKGVQVVKKSEINLTVYTNPKVGWQYKNHLLNESNFKGSKIVPPGKEPLSKVEQKLKTDIPACKPFEMNLPDNLTNKASSNKTKNNEIQYQLLIEGEKPKLYNNQPGKWSQPLAQRIDNQLKMIKKHLYDATDLKQPNEKRAVSWNKCKKQIDNLNSSLKSNPKNRDPKQLKQHIDIAVKVKTHFFKGDDSVLNKLNKYTQKNSEQFEPSDQKGMKGVSLNLDKFKESLDALIKQIEKLIQVLKTLISPKV